MSKKKQQEKFKKILLTILVISILLIPIVVNQYSLYRLKFIDDEALIQKCIDNNPLTREQCEETIRKVYREFFEDYEKVPFIQKYQQGFIDSFSYNRYGYFWFIPLILFLIYLKQNLKK